MQSHLKLGQYRKLPISLLLSGLVATCICSVRAQTGSVGSTQIEQVISRLRSQQSTDADTSAAVALGTSLNREKRYREAAELFAAILEKHPAEPDALYGAALAAFNLGKTSEAETLAQRATEIALAEERDGPDAKSRAARRRTTDALVLLAIVLAVKGDNAQALKTAEQAVAASPDHFDAQFTLGRARYSVGDMTGATAAFRAAVALNPDDPRALFFLGTTLERAGDISAAIESYRQLIQKHPQSADGYLGVGILLVRGTSKQVEEGIEKLKRALAIDPDLYEGRITLGRTLVARGRAAESLDHLIRASKLAPENPEPHYQLSLAYRRLGQKERAAHERELVKQIHERRRAPSAQRNRERP